MYVNILLALSLLSVCSVVGNPHADKCNPIQCPYSSTGCYRCQIRDDPTCIRGEQIGVGICIEPVPLSQKKSYNQKYTDRCRRATDPNGNDVLPANAYVKGCREFEYTCADGTCEPVKGLPRVCKKNIVEAGSGKCDPDLDALQLIIPSLWEKYTEKQFNNICKDHGGVKYDYLRCDSLFGFTGQSICDENSPFKVDGLSTCENDPPTVNKDTYECTETEIVASAEACCLLNDIPGECRPLIEIGPNYPNSGVEATGGSDDLPAAGIVFEMELERTSERCCCTQSCTCFGDSHCDSLFGAYEISRSSGDFQMYEEGDFAVDVSIGDPGGVILEATITMSDGSQYSIDSDACIAQAATPLYYPLPDGWKFTPGKGMQSSPVYHIVDKESKSVLLVTCIQFKQNIGQNKGIHTRLDLEVLKNVPLIQGTDNALCCPTPNEVYDILNSPDTDGFCVKTTEDSFTVLPDGKSFNSRRLVTDLGTVGGSSDNSTVEIGEDPAIGLSEKQKSNLIEQARDLCAELAKESGPGCGRCCNYEDCIQIDYETGRGNCLYVDTDVVKRLEGVVYEGEGMKDSKSRNGVQSCYSFASDATFQPSKQDKCARGIELQAKRKNDADWTTVLFFPEDVEFCDGKITILFQHTKLNNEPIDLTTHDIRFVTCTPEPECAFECLPEVKIASMKSRIFYPCKSDQAKSQLLEQAFGVCESCSSVKECIKECISSGVCECKD